MGWADVSKLANIKRRLEAARGLAWHSYKLARYKDGRVDYAVAPSPLERTHFSEGEAAFVVCSREDMAKLLAVVKAESAGLTPKQVAGVYAYSLGLEADSAIKEELRQKRIAWEAIA